MSCDYLEHDLVLHRLIESKPHPPHLSEVHRFSILQAREPAFRRVSEWNNPYGTVTSGPARQRVAYLGQQRFHVGRFPDKGIRLRLVPRMFGIVRIS
jgi:hypothetical protein